MTPALRITREQVTGMEEEEAEEEEEEEERDSEIATQLVLM